MPRGHDRGPFGLDQDPGWFDLRQLTAQPPIPPAGRRLYIGSDGAFYVLAPDGSKAGPFTSTVNPMTTVGDIIVGGTVAGGVAAPTRLATGGANTLLHGTTTPAYSAVVEADLSLTDLTTANATTSQHGFLKKLDNTSTHYMDGTGNWSSPAGGGGGGGGVTMPLVIQRNAYNANGQNPGPVLGSAPVSGHRLVMVLNLTGRASTGVTQTNVTWTQLLAVASGAGSHYELWVGVVSGTGGTTINVTTGSSNYWTITVMEVTDLLTPTLGVHSSGAMSGSGGMYDGLAALTAGHFVAVFGGADNTTVCKLIWPTVPYVAESGHEHGNGYAGALALLYAPTSGTWQVAIDDGWSSVGEYLFAEIT